MTIRPERLDDAGAIREVLRSSFPSEDEATLVDRLRDAGKARVSLVAEVDGLVVGHVLFSPVSVDPSEAGGFGLAPLAVLATHRRAGVGAGLVGEGLAACRREGCPFVVVLGDPGYYGRFGFSTASAIGLRNEYGVDREFMVVELTPSGLPTAGGLVRYGPEFSTFET
jgi:putative acetyltransferase